MDVDEDIDGMLLRNFSCMGTNDKDVLIEQLQKLVGNDISVQTAHFYLDMSNWNVQAAVCSYFDLQRQGKLPRMTFVKDVTLGEGESIPPNTKFTKTWKILNSGDERWPLNCSLIFTAGFKCGAEENIGVTSISAGEEIDISLEMVSPSEQGFYFSKWRMATNQGAYFGDVIWVILQVDNTGTLGLLQQMENLNALGGHQIGNGTTNPFGPR